MWKDKVSKQNFFFFHSLDCKLPAGSKNSRLIGMPKFDTQY